MNLDVGMVNASGTRGGAARAAYRLHRALLAAGVGSVLEVVRYAPDDPTVITPVSKPAKAFGLIRPVTGRIPGLFLKTENPGLHSPAILPSMRPHKLNRSDVDIVHLHWINDEMLSIEDIPRFKKPLLWTLHDMWPFCGAEHLAWDNRYREGYLRSNRPGHESGFDLNRWVWRRKRRAWNRPIHIVTPSRWLAECAGESLLMRDWPVTTIPNTLDTDIWKPADRRASRRLLGLPEDVPLIVFGAFGGTRALHKGADLLFRALEHLRGEFPGLELLLFGQRIPAETADIGFPVHYIGHLHDDLSLRLVYSAADASVIPSRQDNLPNGGLEAHACGTPVIAFDTCGLPDIVSHKETGWLAAAFDPVDLAEGIRWVISDRERLDDLSQRARRKAEELWSHEAVVPQYLDAYRRAMNQSN